MKMKGTARERRILKHRIDGRTYKEIGEKLGLSTSYVAQVWRGFEWRIYNKIKKGLRND